MNNWLNFNRFSLPCVLCGDYGRRDPHHGPLCPACDADLRHQGALCPRCALPLPGEQTGTCGACLAEPPHFDASHALYPYHWPLDRLVTRMKFAGRLDLARGLGVRLGDELAHKSHGLDALVPVPAHPTRRRERGYNQAEIIAAHAAQACGLPVLHDSVVRRRATPAQTSLDARARRRNLRGAFAVRETARNSVVGRHLALVDDVMTTGSTVNELARVLKRAGAAQVEVWVVARAPSPA